MGARNEDALGETGRARVWKQLSLQQRLGLSASYWQLMACSRELGVQVGELFEWPRPSYPSVSESCVQDDHQDKQTSFAA